MLIVFYSNLVVLSLKLRKGTFIHNTSTIYVRMYIHAANLVECCNGILQKIE